MLAFELVAGSPPFMHEDRMVMYRRIVDGVFSCPTHFSVVSMLQPCTATRLMHAAFSCSEEVQKVSEVLPCSKVMC